MLQLILASMVITLGCAFMPRHVVITQSFIPLSMSDQKGRITMYTKSTCVFCSKALAILQDQYKLNVTLVDITQENSPDRASKISQMVAFSGGRTTVPQVFFNSQHIGGYADLSRLENEGKLEEMVRTVKETPATKMQEHWYHPWY